MPKTSVGMPVYNGERYVGIAIESVLAQTHADLELVICDNGSTDRTVAICRDYERRDSRIRFFRNDSNIGAAGNFCRVFNLSTGKYFRWLSADDYLGSQSVALCEAVLDARPEVVLCCTRAEIVDAEGRTIRNYDEVQRLEQASARERFHAAQNQDPWCHAVYGLMRRDVLARTRLLGAFGSSDKTLLAELSLHGRFAEVPETHFFRRHHEQAYSFVTSSEQNRIFYKPSGSGHSWLQMEMWQHVCAYTRAIGRAPLKPAERMSLWRDTMRICWWKKGELCRELVAFAGSLLLGGSLKHRH